MTILEKLFKVENQVLIVTKPHRDFIEAICHQFSDYRNHILFEFTIGACDDQVLSYWEPGAPQYAERVASLQYAYENGFQTSVSAEPMLDSANIDLLIADLLPHITDSIWIGKMNNMGRVSKIADVPLQAALRQIEAGQTDAIIQSIYERHKGNLKIKWKASIREVMGQPMANLNDELMLKGRSDSDCQSKPE